MPLANSHYDTHNPGGATFDWFRWHVPYALFEPGTYTIEVIWAAHNGNGLSRGSAKATGSVTVQAPQPTKLSGEDKCQLDRLVRADDRAAERFGQAGDALIAKCPACANALYQVSLAYADLAVKNNKLVADPPDPDFTTIPVATSPGFSPLPTAAEISADAATALNALLRLVTDISGKSRAALSAIEKAQGAHAAHDSTWETKQTVAAAGFLKDMATGIDQLPAAMDLAGARLKAGGFPDATIDKAGVSAYLAKVIGSGLPAPSYDPNWLRDKAGLADADIKKAAILVATDAQDFAGVQTLFDPFSPNGFAEAAAAAVTRLDAEATALLAQPLLIYTTEPNPVPTSAAPQPTASRSRPSESASLLSNSGFETPDYRATPSYQTLIAGKRPGLAGWTLAKGRSSSAPAASPRPGTSSSAGGNDTAAGPGTITQDVAVTRGHHCRLSFQLARLTEPHRPGGSGFLGRQEGDVYLRHKGTPAKARLGGARWTAAARQTDVTFTSLTTGIRAPTSTT